MSPEVAAFAADSGPLLGVLVEVDTPVSYSRVGWVFAQGTLELGCDRDTDEVVVHVAEASPDVVGAHPFSEAFAGLRGLYIEYLWLLTNHRGFTDAVQLRLRGDEGQEQMMQLEVAGSALTARRVSDWTAG